MNFSQEELSMLSDALLAMIQSESSAVKLVYDKKITDDIRNHISKIQVLNSKVCTMMEDKTK